MKLIDELQRRYPSAELTVIGDDIVWHSGNPPDEAAMAEVRLAVLAANKADEIDADFRAACAQIRAGYPDDEIQSWPQQQAQAEAYTANNAAPTPLLTAMATARGITVAELASRILANAATYSQAYGQALGVKQARQDALAVPGLTAEQIAAI